jgi:hypothetical protein
MRVAPPPGERSGHVSEQPLGGRMPSGFDERRRSRRTPEVVLDVGVDWWQRPGTYGLHAVRRPRLTHDADAGMWVASERQQQVRSRRARCRIDQRQPRDTVLSADSAKEHERSVAQRVIQELAKPGIDIHRHGHEAAPRGIGGNPGQQVVHAGACDGNEPSGHAFTSLFEDLDERRKRRLGSLGRAYVFQPDRFSGGEVKGVL